MTIIPYWKTKEHRKRNNAKQNRLHKLAIKHNLASYEAFAMGLKRKGETIGLDSNENLLVICAVCKKYYIPTVEKARARLNSKDGKGYAFLCPKCEEYIRF